MAAARPTTGISCEANVFQDMFAAALAAFVIILNRLHSRQFPSSALLHPVQTVLMPSFL